MEESLLTVVFTVSVSGKRVLVGWKQEIFELLMSNIVEWLFVNPFLLSAGENEVNHFVTESQDYRY